MKRAIDRIKRLTTLVLCLLAFMLLSMSNEVVGQYLASKTPSPRLASSFDEMSAKALGGTAVSVSDSKTITTPTLFFAQVGSSGKSTAGGVLPNNPAVTISARTRPAAEHIGQRAESLLVASYHDVWYMKTPQGWQPWNQQLATLIAVDTHALTANDDNIVEAQLSLVGKFSIYVGYRLNGIIYYTPTSLDFSLVPTKTELSVSQFKPLSSTANTGDLITLNATISNTGNTPAAGVLRYYQSSDAHITIDDNEICTNSINTLAPEQAADYQCQTPAPPPATHYYGVCLNSSIESMGTATNQCSGIIPIKVSAAQAGRAIPEQAIILKPSNTQTRCVSPQILENGQCVMPSNIAKATFKLNDTGINACTDGELDGLNCPIVDYLMQDAETGRDFWVADDNDGHAGFSFTKISETGAVLSATATQWSCVKDNVTGLMWEVKTNDQSLHHKDWTYSWYEPDNHKNGGMTGIQNAGACGGTSTCDTHGYVQAVNAQGWCGANDWRMPSLNELFGLGALDRINPAIDSVYFPNTPATWYWSASPAGVDGYAWYIFTSYGLISWNPKAEKGLVRLVRG